MGEQDISQNLVENIWRGLQMNGCLFVEDLPRHLQRCAETPPRKGIPPSLLLLALFFFFFF
eukprot:c21479_g3_i1 orf=66-248(+)